MADYLTRQETQPIEFPANKANLSIRLRPDGFSFAWAEDGRIRTIHIDIPDENPTGGLHKALFGSEWPDRQFERIHVCVPTDKAVLIPSEMDRPESYEAYMTGTGISVSEDTRILSASVSNDKTLLYAVCEQVMAPLKERFGEKLVFFHPLYVNLTQPAEKGNRLLIDRAGGYAHYTLASNESLLFCDVFPAENDDAILFHVNRIIVLNKIGSFSIRCSGDRLDATAGMLSGYYKEVGIHPDGEQRNLYFPLR